MAPSVRNATGFPALPRCPSHKTPATAIATHRQTINAATHHLRGAALSAAALQTLGRILHTYLNALGEHGDVRSRQYLVLNVALLLQELLAATGTERLTDTLTRPGAADASIRTPANRRTADAQAAPVLRRGGKVPSTQAAMAPDSPDNIALFQQAIEEITGEPAPTF